MTAGRNLPGFRAAQLEFAAHIRHPERNPAPADVPAERMAVYVRLFYNNVERLLAFGFPRTKAALGETRWHGMIRDFLHRHPSESPISLELQQEFLAYVGERVGAGDAPELPDWLLELCHYEWVRLALRFSEAEIPEAGFDRAGDLASEPILVSPLIWPLAYRHAVHRIDGDHQPEVIPEQPTQLVVHRRSDDRVHVLELNAPTLRLLLLLQEAQAEVPLSGEAACARLAEEMPQIEGDVLRREGLATLLRLRRAEIVLGTLPAGGAPAVEHRR